MAEWVENFWILYIKLSSKINRSLTLIKMSLLCDTDLSTHRSMFNCQTEKFIVRIQMNTEVCLIVPIRSYTWETLKAIIHLSSLVSRVFHCTDSTDTYFTHLCSLPPPHVLNSRSYSWIFCITSLPKKHVGRVSYSFFKRRVLLNSTGWTSLRVFMYPTENENRYSKTFVQ